MGRKSAAKQETAFLRWSFDYNRIPAWGPFRHGFRRITHCIHQILEATTKLRETATRKLLETLARVPLTGLRTPQKINLVWFPFPELYCLSRFALTLADTVLLRLHKNYRSGKKTHAQTVAWSYDMEGHAQKC